MSADDYMDDFYDEDEMTMAEIEESLKHGYGRCGYDVMVGHGGTPLDNCGKFRVNRGCLDVKAHELPLMLQGEKEFKDKIWRFACFYSCHKPNCPMCFRSWARREAYAMESRLVEGMKRFGDVEHIIISIPPSRFELDFKATRRLAIRALEKRGVVGGGMIHHAFRLDRSTRYWKPYNYHYHVLGFIEGGFKCRGCSKITNGRCMDLTCREFMARCDRLQMLDKFVVKVAEEQVGVKVVAGERRSIVNTGFYQLTHSSYRLEGKRSQIVTWFGKLSYRKLKVDKRHPLVCRLCGKEHLPALSCLSSIPPCTDRSKNEFRSESVEDLYDADGNEVWVERGLAIDFAGR